MHFLLSGCKFYIMKNGNCDNLLWFNYYRCHHWKSHNLLRHLKASRWNRTFVLYWNMHALKTLKWLQAAMFSITHAIYNSCQYYAGVFAFIKMVSCLMFRLRPLVEFAIWFIIISNLISVYTKTYIWIQI